MAYFRRFTYVDGRDTDRGLPGWLLDKRPDFDPVDNLGVVHDSMEHFTLDGSITDEGWAFGCMLWGRTRTGFWTNGSSYASALADEAVRFICAAGSVPETRARPLAVDGMEDQIQELRKRAGKELETLAYSYDYDPERWERDIGNYCNLIRQGFRKAERRWPYWGYSNFMAIFNDLMEDRRWRDSYQPGDKLIVKITPSRCMGELEFVTQYD